MNIQKYILIVRTWVNFILLWCSNRTTNIKQSQDDQISIYGVVCEYINAVSLMGYETRVFMDYHVDHFLSGHKFSSMSQRIFSLAKHRGKTVLRADICLTSCVLDVFACFLHGLQKSDPLVWSAIIHFPPPWWKQIPRLGLGRGSYVSTTKTRYVNSSSLTNDISTSPPSRVQIETGFIYVDVFICVLIRIKLQYCLYVKKTKKTWKYRSKLSAPCIVPNHTALCTGELTCT